MFCVGEKLMILLKRVTQVTPMLSQWYGKANLLQLQRIEKLLQYFYATFDKRDCYLCSSPGRVELIGNHTDHNGGSVIGCTVNKDILAVFAPSGNHKFVISSQGFRNLTFDISQINHRERNSRGVAKGVLKGLHDRHYNIGGVLLSTNTNIPIGGGMSSSASYELMLAQIQNQLYNESKVDVLELAKIGQFAENVYFNKPCGLLDQSVIAIGGVVKLDFKNGIDYQSLDYQLDGLELVVINTGGSHSNLTEQYAGITKDMHSIATYFNQDKLCNVNEQEVRANKHSLTNKCGERAYNRAIHFYEENERVKQAEQAICQGNIDKLLSLIEQSGNSSRYLLKNCSYEGGDNTLISALDYIKHLLGDNGAVRVHGGGFAGTILCVVRTEYYRQFVSKCCEHFGDNNVSHLRIRTSGTSIF